MALYQGVTKSWADGEYTFRLRIAELKALQASTKAGVYVLFKRMMTSDCFIDDITETIRLALVGGGTDAKEAKRLVEDYILQPQRFNDALDLAQEIFSSSLEGYWGEELPNQQPPADQEDNPSIAQMDSSPSEKSPTA
jgi:hypothetical protein